MKLSEFALTIMKNFSSINSGIVLNSGTLQRTWSTDKSILVEVDLEETFPCSFGIYDLNQFLGNVTTLKNPDLTFTSENVMMNDGETVIKYRACDTSLITSPPNKSLILNDPDVTFDLSQVSLSKILKLATMNSLSNISIIGENGKLRIQAHDKSNDKSNEIFTELEDWSGKDFICTFRLESIKVIPDNYTVSIKLGAFSNFKSKTRNLSYFITLLTKTK
jgi:hypothetical protein